MFDHSVKKIDNQPSKYIINFNNLIRQVKNYEHIKIEYAKSIEKKMTQKNIEIFINIIGKDFQKFWNVEEVLHGKYFIFSIDLNKGICYLKDKKKK
jgi:predicted metal-binding protein